MQDGAWSAAACMQRNEGMTGMRRGMKGMDGMDGMETLQH